MAAPARGSLHALFVQHSAYPPERLLVQRSACPPEPLLVQPAAGAPEGPKPARLLAQRARPRPSGAQAAPARASRQALADAAAAPITVTFVYPKDTRIWEPSLAGPIINTGGSRTEPVFSLFTVDPQVEFAEYMRAHARERNIKIAELRFTRGYEHGCAQIPSDGDSTSAELGIRDCEHIYATRRALRDGDREYTLRSEARSRGDARSRSPRRV